MASAARVAITLALQGLVIHTLDSQKPSALLVNTCAWQETGQASLFESE